jgi:hypothetical protein
MKYWIPILFLVAAFVMGCHKKETPAPSASPEAPAAADAAPGSPAPTPVPPMGPPPRSVTAWATNTPQQGVQGEVDAFLTTQLRVFVEQNRRMPQSFYEFASRRLDSTPRPPAGKKWAIDASDITVKAVPAQ